MFSLANAEFVYEPYPICYARDVFPAGEYDQMCREYPDIKLFEYKPELGHKYSLSEANNGPAYAKFIAGNKTWSDFHERIKSPEFISETLTFLTSHGVDLGINRYSVASKRKGRKPSLLARLKRETELSARFEFSMMTPDGGHIRPHTDAPDKLITFVLSMIAPGEWDQAWGGGTQVCLPNDRTKIYNHVNKYMDFGDVSVLTSYAFHPNQCLLFIKTYNSWHQVEPTKGPANGAMRKTLTVNIERKA